MSYDLRLYEYWFLIPVTEEENNIQAPVIIIDGEEQK